MKSVRKILIYAITLLLIIGILPINVATSATEYTDTIYYYTKIKFEGTITNSASNEKETLSKESSYIPGDVKDKEVLDIINEYKEEFTKLAIEKNGTNIQFNENIDNRYYEANDELINNKWDIIINTVTTWYQTLVIEGTSVFEYRVYNVTKIENNEDLSFIFDIPEEKFQDNLEVFIDKELVDKSLYEIKSDSIISFKKEFVDNLSIGEHLLDATVKTGEASTTFTIVKHNNRRNINALYIFFLVCFLVILETVNNFV